MKFNKRVLLELKAMALCLVVACMEAPILYAVFRDSVIFTMPPGTSSASASSY